MPSKILEILDAPIDWTRDDELTEVADNASVKSNLEQRWSKINKDLFDGVPVEPDIKGAEEALLARHALLQDGSLTPTFDWKHDFELARFTHRFHLANLEYVRNNRVSYLEFWKNWMTEASTFSRDLSLHGQKTIYLLHGAVAVGALNILANNTSSAQTILAAKYAIVFAAIGIFLAGLGQLIIFNFTIEFLNRVRGKLLGNVRWRKMGALPRYFRRYGWLAEVGNKAIYGSIFGFGTYVVILLIILLA